jgi:hypothetical protein
MSSRHPFTDTLRGITIANSPRKVIMGIPSAVWRRTDTAPREKAGIGKSTSGAFA